MRFVSYTACHLTSFSDLGITRAHRPHSVATIKDT